MEKSSESSESESLRREDFLRRRGDGESSFFSSDGSGSLPSHIRLSSAAGTSSGYISTLAARPATSCAVRPRWSLAPPDAPAARSWLATFVRPHAVARCSAVNPASSHPLTSAPCSNRTATTRPAPAAAAYIRGVLAEASSASTAAPALCNKHLAHLAWSWSSAASNCLDCRFLPELLPPAAQSLLKRRWAAATALAAPKLTRCNAVRPSRGVRSR